MGLIVINSCKNTASIIKYVVSKSLLKFVSINFFIYDKLKESVVQRVKTSILLKGNTTK